MSPDKGMHDIYIPDDSYRSPGTKQEDYSAYSQDSSTRVLFKDLERHLIEYIRQSDIVLGCVAWLTSEPILRALAKIKGVSIIVQKEDFLRPDITSPGQYLWAHKLRKLYDQLPSRLCRYDLGGWLNHMSVACDPTIEPVRCVGNYNTEKHPAFPRSHHKFIVFCNAIQAEDACTSFDEDGHPCTDEGRYPYDYEIVPTHVWTGSYNFTKNAGMSFENALVLRDPAIVQAYYEEYSQIAALSEPLDWKSEWSAPQWRIGT